MSTCWELLRRERGHICVRICLEIASTQIVVETAAVFWLVSNVEYLSEHPELSKLSLLFPPVLSTFSSWNTFVHERIHAYASMAESLKNSALLLQRRRGAVEG